MLFQTPSKVEFTDISKERLMSKVVLFETMLIAKSRICASRDQSDYIQKTHVSEAWDKLLNKPKIRLLGEILTVLGSSALGASLSGLSPAVNSNDSTSIIIFFWAGIVGGISVFIGFLFKKN